MIPSNARKIWIVRLAKFVPAECVFHLKKVKFMTVKAATDAVANAGSADASVDRQHGPRVEVLETSFDFGILEKSAANEKGEHPFKIKNVGDETLTLADGGKGCFCTDFEISHKSLRPGETATILFKWDAARSGGVFNQGVRVLTNDPQTPEVDFAVRGLYTAPIVCEPNEISFQNASAATETTSTSSAVMPRARWCLRKRTAARTASVPKWKI